MSIKWWMDKEDVVYISNGILPGNEKKWNPAICSNVDGTGGYYAKWNKSVRESQISYIFTHMWNLRNLTEDHGGREGEKNSYREGGRQTIKWLLNTENKLGVLRWSSRLVFNFRSGHDLTVCEFKPCVRLWADSSEFGACSRFCVSLSLCPSPDMFCFPLTLRNKQ